MVLIRVYALGQLGYAKVASSRLVLTNFLPAASSTPAPSITIISPVTTNSTFSTRRATNRSCRNLPPLCNDAIGHHLAMTSSKNLISPWRIASSPLTTISSTMNKVKEQPLPSCAHAPTPQTTKRNKRFWILTVLAGMLLFTANFRSVLKATSWKPRMRCGKGRFYTKSTLHYTLPSGDKIPSVALGESVP